MSCRSKYLQLACAAALSLASLPSHSNNAVYQNGRLDLSAVALPDGNGAYTYVSAMLELISSAPVRFKLHHYAPVETPARTDGAFFDAAQGLLHLPHVVVDGVSMIAGLRVLTLDGAMGFEVIEAGGSPLDIPSFFNSMNQLDRAFVNVIFLSNTATANAATVASTRRAMQTFNHAWETFRAYYLGAYPDNAQWQAWFTDVDSRLAGANANLAAIDSTAGPADLNLVHDTMEEFRMIIKQLRESLGLAHVMDHLTMYHAAMGPIANTVENISSPEDLNPTVINAIQSQYQPLAEALALIVPEIEKGAKSLGLSASKQQMVKAMIATQQDNLHRLGNAGHSGNLADGLAAAKQIKPTFVKTFMAFGDFLRLDAQAMQDMAALELAYMPVLFHSNTTQADEARTERTRAALQTYQEARQRFMSHFQGSLPGLLGWGGALERLNAALNEAQAGLDAITDYPADLSTAHDAVEKVRYEMKNLRTIEGIDDYVTDAMTFYHASLDIIGAALNTAENGILSEETMAALETQLTSIAQELNNMVTALAHMPLNQFGFDLAKHQALQQSAVLQVENFQRLHQAVQSRDSATALAAGAQAKPLFAGFFRTFGDI
jgi:hypothetical protein